MDKPTLGKWRVHDFDTRNIVSDIEDLPDHVSYVAMVYKPNDLPFIVALQNAAISINPSNPMAVAENMGKVVKATQRVYDWLIVIAEQADKQAKDTRFITISEAANADAQNYRVIARDLSQALSSIKEEKK